MLIIISNWWAMHRDRVSVVLVCTLKHIASIPFQYKKMESNRGELRKRIFEVVNFVNMVSQSHGDASFTYLQDPLTAPCPCWPGIRISNTFTFNPFLTTTFLVFWLCLDSTCLLLCLMKVIQLKPLYVLIAFQWTVMVSRTPIRPSSGKPPLIVLMGRV